MKIIDIIAILGALAWLPQIISWVYNWLKKPKISIYHDGEAEVGYTKNGNVFNLRFSFLARDKHALIDDIELVLTDKDGAHHTLKWMWYSETFYELQGPAGNSTMAKQQNAIAINAFRDVLIEKFIGFQSESFLDKRKQLAYKLTTLVENQKTSGNIDMNVIKSSQEYNDLIRLYKNSLLWKPGEYSVIARVHIADTNETIEHAFSFRLSELEIDTLNKNIEFAKSVVDCEFIDTTQQLTGAWLWAKPTMN